MSEAVDWLKIVITILESDLFRVIIGGGGAAALLTLLYNKRATRRQEIVDMGKIRIDRISKDAQKYHLRIERYALDLSRSLQTPNDSYKMFYDLARFLEHLERAKKDGKLLYLSDTDAETAVIGALATAWHLLVSRLNAHYQAYLKKLFNENETVLDVENKIMNDPKTSAIFREFLRWYNDNRDSACRASRYLYYYHELLIYELNVTYELWYGYKVRANRELSAECRRMVYEEYPKYARKRKINLRNLY